MSHYEVGWAGQAGLGWVGLFEMGIGISDQAVGLVWLVPEKLSVIAADHLH